MNLTNFIRTPETPAADWGEKIGDFGLSCLSTVFGRSIKVIGNKDEIKFETHSTSLAKRITAIACSIIFLPFVAALSLAGYISYTCSTSRKEITELYLNKMKQEHAQPVLEQPKSTPNNELILLVEKAKAKEAEKERELIDFTEEIYLKRDEFNENAIRNSKSDIEIIYRMTRLVIDHIESKGRKLKEILENPNARAIFEQSIRLKIVLKLYEKYIHHKIYDPVAVKLAIQLGLQNDHKDLPKLKKGILKLVLENHPDKNPNGNEDLVKIGNAILDLLKDGTYEQYEELLQKFRGNKA